MKILRIYVRFLGDADMELFIRTTKIRKPRLKSAAVGLLLAVLTSGGVSVFAHGGEDHGDEKAQPQTTAKGTVSRTARAGDLEVMIKHPQLEPDTELHGRLFITKFATNEPVEGSDISAEIESLDGSIQPVPVEKTDTKGSYTLAIPATPEGNYTVRVKLTADGKADTVSFSSVKFEHPAAETSGSGFAWLTTILFLLAGIAVLGMFACLVYFVWRLAGEKQVSDEAITV